ncbi:hypothetical protein M501DRAFT_1003875 [Patellaria atrata CBS 101060]|uniref:Uncharacterized protein n=1 Tax=Patellaria atrata CBS 101060 TaxID=1346257 RepID=A0A9P4SB05_9PEZI|nr:hypothetical protein M501DRAFT_1003875 [Patellaria atrata CBS 101060]
MEQHSAQPRCCCGNEDCPYIVSNGKLLEGLEQDVQTAAQLGQALLLRHESCMAESEKERELMTTSIERLEEEKRDLEIRNARTIEENRSLLDQLEGLNNAVAESDEHIKALEATLHATQLELQRLTVLAARTESLEKQLTDLENEQAQLQNSFVDSVEAERSAIQRWRRAERTIVELQDQIDRIEKEAREDRERHVEVVGRMERRRAVERELETAAGRLKGTAAAKTSGRDKNGSNVVSHFVKDILQDNANLQLGIVELREMLMNSNEMVEKLREQLTLHRPLEDELEGTKTPTLRAEMEKEEKPVRNSEVHFHHHYHVPTALEGTVRNSKTVVPRRVKKRRNIITPGHFTPPLSGRHTPRSSISKLQPPTPSSTAAILSQTSVTIPQPQKRSNRWSVQSNQTAISALSSVPSSPYSNSHRTSSIFDRVFSDRGMESSRPTSPESNDPGSPLFVPIEEQRSTAETPRRSISTPAAFIPLGKSTPFPSTSISDITFGATSNLDPDLAKVETMFDRDVPELNLLPSGHPTIPEENESNIDPLSSPSLLSPGSTTDNDVESLYTPLTHHQETFNHRSMLRRATSHESILSVTGMDIHQHVPTLRSRPSQLLAPGGLYGSPSTSLAESQAVLSNVTALGMSLGGESRDLNRQLLKGMAADQRRPRRVSVDMSSSNKETFGKKVGGWVWGRWGVTPSSSTPSSPVEVSSDRRKSANSLQSDSTKRDGTLHPSSAVSIPGGSRSTVRSNGTKDLQYSSTPNMMKLRAPGVNQSGPIFGFPKEPKTPFKVIVEDIDREALVEGLAEGLTER